MKRPRQRRLLGLMVTLVTVVLTLLTLEAAFRVFSWLGDEATLDDLRGRRPTPQEAREATLGTIIRPSLSPGMVYELIPDLAVDYMGAGLTTAESGFRRPAPAGVERPPRTLRIVGLGDSVMFGHGVGDDETYLALLTRRLTARRPDIAWESLNTAVPGYNTAMEVAVLEERGLAYQADLVIIGFVGNDLYLPNFVLLRPDHLTLQKSYLWRFVGSRLGRATALESIGLVGRRLAANGVDFETDPDRVPPEYAYMVGPDGYRRAMRRLVELRSERGFELVMVNQRGLGRFDQVVRATCAELEVPWVDASPRLHAWLREHGFRHYLGSPLSMGSDDFHPSALGHQLLADALFEYLEASGTLGRLETRVR